MFCSNCGTQVPDNVRFCHNCGSAIIQNANSQPVQQQNSFSYEQPAYQQPTYQQPVAQQPIAAPTEMKFGVNLVYPDGHNEIGDIYISATAIMFAKKSKAVRLAFGLLGSALEKGEVKVKINVADIVAGGKTRIGINPHVYQLTLRNGQVYKLCINNPANLSYMERRFG